MSSSTTNITKLREQTGAGVLDCKKALEESGGDFAVAVDWLRKKGITKVAKRADKVAAEGKVISYIHGAGKLGVLVEVNCETDFVAKTETFMRLASDIAMHIAASSPKYVSPVDVPAADLEREKAIYREQLQSEGKSKDIIEKIVAGKLEKFYSEICLLKQAFIKDEHKTIEYLLAEKTGELGEKITIRRFVRFQLGEGIARSEVDFVHEVAAQL